MASPSELSLEEIRRYLLDNGGSARNQDLVKHFKKFLTDPESRVEARNRFKEYINTLATIKTEEGEKYLVLRKKFRQQNLDLSSPTLSFSGFPTSPISTPDLSTPTSPLREPPPYRPPPVAPLSPISNTSSPVRRYTQDPPVGLPLNLPVEPPVRLPIGILQESPIDLPIGVPYNEPIIEENTSTGASRLPRRETGTSSPIASPPVPPRRKSQDKIKLANKENQGADEQTPKKGRNGSESIKEDDQATPTSNQLTPAEQLSVRERMQRFNRMASETDLPARPNVSTPPVKKRSDKGNEEDDRASVASQLMDGKSREWLVRAAQGDYQALAKLAAEEPRLARIKDPSSTALHWGAKHGDENIVKLIAGTCKDWIKSVNETSNGGYTPLHIALQFDHENIFNLLVQVYGANQDIRDYSGKKPRQYSISQKAAVSQDTMRKIKARKKHTEKDLGFLRIGSLNVRVKRTTEAFNQFLGVTTKASSNNSEKIHKTWGSADNLSADKMMPPPKYAPIKKRRSRRATDFVSSRSNNQQQQQSPEQTASQPSTPTLQGKSATTGRRPASVSALTTGGLLAQTLNSGISTGSIQKDHRQQQQNDSDSDGACGFDSAWRGSA